MPFPAEHDPGQKVGKTAEASEDDICDALSVLLGGKPPDEHDTSTDMAECTQETPKTLWVMPKIYHMYQAVFL